MSEWNVIHENFHTKHSVLTAPDKYMPFSYIFWAYGEHIMNKGSSRTSDQFIWLVSEKKTEAVNAYLIKNRDREKQRDRDRQTEKPCSWSYHSFHILSWWCHRPWWRCSLWRQSDVCRSRGGGRAGTTKLPRPHSKREPQSGLGSHWLQTSFKAVCKNILFSWG